MTFTLEFNGINVELPQETLQEELNEVASSEMRTQNCWKIARHDLAHPPAEASQKVLDALQAQVLESGDTSLIHLFQRAVRNHDSIHPDQKTEPVALFNRHYTPPPYLIPETSLRFEVFDKKVYVTTSLTMVRHVKGQPLILNGEGHEVHKVSVNGAQLKPSQYRVTPHELIFLETPVPDTFDVEIESSIDPFQNKSLEGLYQSGSYLTTQCESESARKIFYTLDRPDVLSRYQTTIIADPQKYPHRISNGNLLQKSEGPGGKEVITWKDPFPKPSYLFAMVLGDFGLVEDSYVKADGEKVKLQMYMDKGKEARGTYPLWIQKKALEFEEYQFDRPYDLEYLKNVAISDFNAGAMENKGLVIYNEDYVLAAPDCSNDNDYITIAEVVSHELAHNWSGNRVTVRNWFELSLKEAFTDFRAALFIEHHFGQDLIRPQAASLLRDHQFPADASEEAHPIQMDSYTNVDSIYDTTTYDKGREVFRMLKTILDAKEPGLFRKAQNHYFRKYDGQAVTFKELLSAMEEVSGFNLAQFKRWFLQPGTPKVSVEQSYDAEKKEIRFIIKQSCPHPKTGKEQQPFHIPLYLELLGPNGEQIKAPQLYHLVEEETVLQFQQIEGPPTPVFLHQFSAPVKLQYSYTDEDLIHIFSHAKDPFCRWEAGQTYMARQIKHLYEDIKKGLLVEPPATCIQTVRNLLRSEKIPPLAKAELLHLPSVHTIIEGDSSYDIKAAAEALSSFQEAILKNGENELIDLLGAHPAPKEYDPASDRFSEEIKIRRLRHTCLNYLALHPKGRHTDLLADLFYRAENFSDRFAALRALLCTNDPKKREASEQFYQDWKHDPVILSNWITTQCQSAGCTVETLKSIEQREGYQPENPNHVRGVYRTFMRNAACYHDEEGAGYRAVTDEILRFGAINPAVASVYLAKEAYTDYHHLPQRQRKLMRAQIERLLAPSVPSEIRSTAKGVLGIK